MYTSELNYTMACSLISDFVSLANAHVRTQKHTQSCHFGYRYLSFAADDDDDLIIIVNIIIDQSVSQKIKLDII